MGAGIEIWPGIDRPRSVVVAPARGRRLKFDAGNISVHKETSPPARGAGVEIPAGGVCTSDRWVAPFAGARIEICRRLVSWPRLASPPREGGGD